MEKDMIKNPAHYTEGRKYQPKDVIRDWGLNFNLGNAVKYISRAGRKEDIVQDLRKAQEYLQFEIDVLEAERNSDKVEDAYKRRIVRLYGIPDTVSLDEAIELIVSGRWEIYVC